MPSHVSRRTVARGAAWSVPIAAISVAAPAFALSPANAATVTGVTVCQCAGQGTKKYKLTATFTNTSNHTFTVTDVVITEASNTLSNQTPNSSATLNIAAGPGSTPLSFYFNRQSNGTNGTYTIQYVLTDTTASYTFPVTSFTTASLIVTDTCATCA
jgi:hypothetical protein